MWSTIQISYVLAFFLSCIGENENGSLMFGVGVILTTIAVVEKRKEKE